jgi:hypothetical protein
VIAEGKLLSFTRLRQLALALLLPATMAPVTVTAQSFVMEIPDKSQKAEIAQRIGLTDITIRYHRPLVKGRKVWGDLVPYGKVWRTGANTITTISFTDPVTIEGKPLAAGTYGLHMIPNEGEWTVIFSKNSTSWGSFTYDAAEDALRVNVKPQTSEMHEALTFSFDDVSPDATTTAMQWEKVRVPFRVAVDVRELIPANFKKQLRTLAGFTWISWDDVAGYLLSQNLALDDALAYSNKSIEIEDQFDNEITKSKILTALKRNAEAANAQQRALELGTPAQVNGFATGLLKAKSNQEAFAIFRENARKYPNDWIVHEGLARMYSAQGRFDDAEKEMKIAWSGAPEKQKNGRAELLKKAAAKQDINQ